MHGSKYDDIASLSFADKVVILVFFDEAVKTSHYESIASCVAEDADAPAAFAAPPSPPPTSPLCTSLGTGGTNGGWRSGSGDRGGGMTTCVCATVQMSSAKVLIVKLRKKNSSE